MSDTPIYDEVAARHPAATIAERVDGWCEDRPPGELTDRDGEE